MQFRKPTLCTVLDVAGILLAGFNVAVLLGVTLWKGEGLLGFALALPIAAVSYLPVIAASYVVELLARIEWRLRVSGFTHQSALEKAEV